MGLSDHRTLPVYAKKIHNYLSADTYLRTSVRAILKMNVEFIWRQLNFYRAF